jgi:hypothetical protein
VIVRGRRGARSAHPHPRANANTQKASSPRVCREKDGGTRSAVDCFSKGPSLCLSPPGERGRQNTHRGLFGRPFSQPHPLADAATLRRKLAKARLRGEGQDEGGLREAMNRIQYESSYGAIIQDLNVMRRLSPYQRQQFIFAQPGADLASV